MRNIKQIVNNMRDIKKNVHANMFYVIWGMWGLFGGYRAHKNYINTHVLFRNFGEKQYYFIDNVCNIIGGVAFYSVPPFMFFAFYKEICNFEDFINKR